MHNDKTTAPELKALHSSETEHIILGGILSSDDSLVDAMTLLKPELFHSRANKEIFLAIQEVYDETGNCDLLLLFHRLDAKNKLNSIGGKQRLNSLTQGVYGMYNIQYYVRILQEFDMRRRLQNLLLKLGEITKDKSIDPFEAIELSENYLFDLGQKYLRGEYKKLSQGINISEIIDPAYEKEDALFSGFRNLDRITQGWEKGNIIIIGARPSVGKTALSLCIMHNTIRLFKKPVAIFSMEMSSNELAKRYISLDAEINHHIIKQRGLNEAQKEKARASYTNLKNSPIFIDDTGHLTSNELRAKARRMHQKENLSLIIIDYIQLMSGGEAKRNNNANREQEVSSISRQLKALAKELGVPIIVLSQLSRGVEYRQSKRPVLSDLRESGGIEQDADIVMLLYRAETCGIKQDENTGESTEGMAELIVAKNRNGKTGTAQLEFEKSLMKFKDFEKVVPNSVPPPF